MGSETNLYLIDPAIARASLSILTEFFNLCFSPGLNPSSDVGLDLSLDELLKKTLFLSSFALEEVDEVVMVDDASEVEFDRSLVLVAVVLMLV